MSICSLCTFYGTGFTALGSHIAKSPSVSFLRLRLRVLVRLRPIAMICGTKCMTDLPIILQRTILQHRFNSLGSHIGKSRLYLSDWSLAMRRGKKCMADQPIISHKIISIHGRLPKLILRLSTCCAIDSFNKIWLH